MTGHAPLVFWQNIVSPHQAALLSALSTLWREAGNGETILACERSMSSERRRQGWQAPKMAGVEIVALEEGHTFDSLKTRFFGQKATHVCSGFHAIPLAWRALRESMKLGERTFVLAEQPQPDTRGGLAKPLLYRLHAMRFASRLGGVMAYGDLASTYYRRVGFPQVHTIGYTVANEVPPSATSSSHRTAVNLLFVGSQLHLKGLDLLLSALRDPAMPPPPAWHLTVVSGDDFSVYRERAKAHGFLDCIDWRGPMPNPEVRSLMTTSDALILPSRYDGWGAVVNEALHAGTRVIVSDRCGASCVIQDPSIGHVFRSGSVPALRANLSEAVRRGPLADAERGAIANWSRQAISPGAMARYMFEILRDVGATTTVTPPWTTVTPA